MNQTLIKVGIIGGTGYTGVELLRLLAQHPYVHVSAVTSRGEAGVSLADYFPSLRGHYDDLKFTSPEDANLEQCDVIFFATPHGVAMRDAKKLLNQDIKIIDLSADFRLQSTELFQQYYNMEHTEAELLKKAVYGLPELHRANIKTANLVANPGCYPTVVQLGLIPFLAANMIKPDVIIADCKSGVSGAGRKAELGLLFSELNDNFKAYGIKQHRHHPEIEQGLHAYNTNTHIIFTPHLVPMIRGMFATLYASMTQDFTLDELQNCIESFYKNEPFIDILAPYSMPDTRSVRGANKLRLSIAPKGNQLIILGVQDNLVKGASGQAIQNMNIMFDFPETMGLMNLPLQP